MRLGIDGRKPWRALHAGVQSLASDHVSAATLCSAGIAWLALAYFIPAPPTKITIATAVPVSP
jgi:hypothetical protein